MKNMGLIKTGLIAALSGIILLFPVEINAHFEDIGAAARPVGMGNAFTALANDASSIYYNPAGAALIKNIELIASYNRLYIGLTDNSNLGGGFASVIYPVDEEIGNFGFGWLNLYLAGTYSESTFTLSYSRKLMPSVFVGLNIKLLMKSITGDEYTAVDPLFIEKGYDKNAISADIGMLWRFASQYSIGFMIRDILQPDLGFKAVDRVPMSFKVGFAYRYQLLDLGIDFAYRDKDIDISIGAEQWLFGKTVALRTGLELGSREDRDITAGLGYKDGGSNFQIDYAFIYPLTGILNTYGSHRLSLIMRFGYVEPEPDGEFAGAGGTRTEMLENEVNAVKNETEKLMTQMSENRNLILGSMERTEELKVQVTEDMNTIREEMKKEREEILSESSKQIQEIRQDLSMQREDLDLTKRTTAELREMMIDSTKEIKKMVRITRDTNKAVKEVKKGFKDIVERPSTYLVQEEDSLMSIAKKLYGSENRWVYLYMANKDRIVRGKVIPGQVLVIP